MIDVKNSARQIGGCGVIMLAWLMFIIGYMIYWFAAGGDPELVKFGNECHSNQARRHGGRHFTDLPEQSQLAIVRECQEALKQFMDQRNDRNPTPPE